MDTQWVEDLASLASCGNFSEAARMNNISQSAFSRRIKAFEAWVGAALVDRSNHPVKLTQAGRQMLEAGQQALTRIETERAHIRESLSGPDKYVVTFAAQHSIGWRFFPAWLQAFETEFGPILSRLRADNLPNCVSDLMRCEVDFVLSYESRHARGVDTSPAIRSLQIGADRLVPVCKPDGAGAPQFSIDGQSTAPIPYLQFGPSAPIGWHVEPILRERELLPRLTTIYENSMAGALRIRARDGLGVAWLPLSLVHQDIDSGLLTMAGVDDWAIDVEIRLHRLERNVNPVVRAIWAFLADRVDRPLV